MEVNHLVTPVASCPFTAIDRASMVTSVALLRSLAFLDVVLGEFHGDGVVPSSVAGFHNDLLLSESVGPVFANFVHELDFSFDGYFVHCCFLAKMNGWNRLHSRIGEAEKRGSFVC